MSARKTVEELIEHWEGRFQNHPEKFMKASVGTLLLLTAELVDLQKPKQEAVEPQTEPIKTKNKRRRRK